MLINLSEELEKIIEEYHLAGGQTACRHHGGTTRVRESSKHQALLLISWTPHAIAHGWEGLVLKDRQAPYI